MNPRFLFLSGLFFLLLFPLSAENLLRPKDLTAAVQSGDMGKIDELLGRGVDPDGIDANGRRALILAVDEGRIQVISRLLQGGADPDLTDGRGYTALMRGIISGREDVVSILLEGGADPRVVSDAPSWNGGAPVPVSALSLALDGGLFHLARRLTETAHPHRLIPPEHDVPDLLRLPVLEVPLTDDIWRGLASLSDAADSPDWNDAGPWALHRAARDNDWRSCEKILKGGVSPNRQDNLGVSPLMSAAYHGRHDTLNLLLQNGADPRAVDDRGRTALTYASAAGRLRIVQRLLAEGAPLNPQPGAESGPLWAALAGDHRDVLNLLLEAGADAASPKGPGGVTHLMLAAWMGNTYALGRLLSLSDGGERDNGGRTALAWAVAAFARDRRTGRSIGVPDLGSRLYPMIRLLARREKNPERLDPQPTADIPRTALEAWAPGGRFAGTEVFHSMRPAFIPAADGDGDLILYRILRDEEPG